MPWPKTYSAFFSHSFVVRKVLCDHDLSMAQFAPSETQQQHPCRDSSIEQQMSVVIYKTTGESFGKRRLRHDAKDTGFSTFERGSMYSYMHTRTLLLLCDWSCHVRSLRSHCFQTKESSQYVCSFEQSCVSDEGWMRFERKRLIINILINAFHLCVCIIARCLKVIKTMYQT